MTTITLAHPYARQVEEARAALPRTKLFLTDSGFMDLSDPDVGFYMASVTEGGRKVFLEPNLDDPVRKEILPSHWFPDQVCITWWIDIDVQTGKVWAKPRFSGLFARLENSNPLERLGLQDLCEQLGMGRHRLLLDLGPLIQVGFSQRKDFRALKTLGIDPSVLDLWIPLNHNQGFRESLREAFDL